MNEDLSRILYEKYSGLGNKNVEVTLIDGRRSYGVFIGFFKGDETYNEPYITAWHIAEEKARMSLGIDQFGFLIGEIIDQKDIIKIKFTEDNSIMIFKTK